MWAVGQWPRSSRESKEVASALGATKDLCSHSSDNSCLTAGTGRVCPSRVGDGYCLQLHGALVCVLCIEACSRSWISVTSMEGWLSAVRIHFNIILNNWTLFVHSPRNQSLSSGDFTETGESTLGLGDCRQSLTIHRVPPQLLGALLLKHWLLNKVVPPPFSLLEPQPEHRPFSF